MSRESDIIAAIGARENERRRDESELASLRSKLTDTERERDEMFAERDAAEGTVVELRAMKVAAQARVSDLEGALRKAVKAHDADLDPRAQGMCAEWCWVWDAHDALAASPTESDAFVPGPQDWLSVYETPPEDDGTFAWTVKPASPTMTPARCPTCFGGEATRRFRKNYPCPDPFHTTTTEGEKE